MDSERLQYQKPADPRTTYFFERDDGTVFATEEEEASELLYHTSWQNRVHKSKFLGGCDGKAYLEYIKQQKTKEGELVRQIADKTADMKKYMETQNKLKFEDLLDETDPKLIRVEEIIKQHEEEIILLNEGRNLLRNQVIKGAVEEVKKQIDPNRKPPNRAFMSDNGKTLNANERTQIFGGVKNIKL